MEKNPGQEFSTEIKLTLMEKKHRIFMIETEKYIL
jgi:hypothetical protein